MTYYKEHKIQISPSKDQKKNKDFYNLGQILDYLKKNHNINKESIESVRYLHPDYNAYVLIREKEEIKFDKVNGLHLLVYTNFLKEDKEFESKRSEILNRAKNLNLKLDCELNKITTKPTKKQKREEERKIPKPSDSFYAMTNTGSQETLSEKTKEPDYDDMMDLDIVILTSNPLIYDPSTDKNEKYDLEPKFLSSMNDFNSITDTIYKVIIDCNKNLKASFLPLTEANFDYALKQKPKIIHLICKSTYVKVENEYKPVLIFENERFSMSKIGEKKLKDILSNKKNLSDINLFISTPLAEDVYNMFEKYDFNNIIVQHTTLACISVIVEFNEHFYRGLIEIDKTIEDAFDMAKSDCLGGVVEYQFCCCFHQHLDKCKFKQNFIKKKKKKKKKHLL